MSQIENQDIEQIEVQNDQIKEEQKEPIIQKILSLDVGIVNLGYCVVDSKMNLYEIGNISLKTYDKNEKRSMVEFQKHIMQNMIQFLDGLLQKHPSIQTVVVEQQIGTYSAKQVEFIIQYHFICKYPQIEYFLQNPLCKLSSSYSKKHTQKFDKEHRDETTKKYNQNKNQSVYIANLWLKENNYQETKSRDQCDALLQVMAFLERKQKK